MAVEKKKMERWKPPGLYITFLFVLAFESCVATKGLYKDTDPMTILSNDTILQKLEGSKKVWIVEFYSSWCGHCQAFAPKWLTLTWELKGWRKYVEAGALDCAHEQNYDTCLAFGVESYPTIKFFDINWKNLSKDGKELGNQYPGDKNIKQIRRALIDHIENQPQFDNSVLPFSPVGLEFVREFLSQKLPYKYLALSFDEEKGYSGKILILDTSECKKILVRRVAHTNKEMAERYNVTERPALILVESDGSFRELSATNRTHTGFLAAIDEIVPVIQAPRAASTTHASHLKENATDDNADFQLNSTEVYMLDLVSGVSFALRREVPKKKLIDGDALKALKEWVNLLLQCLPAEREISKFIAMLDKWLNENARSETLTSAEYLKYIETNQFPDSYLPSKIRWRGCQGSEARYRGFPCSLWMLFHTMTVRCGSKHSQSSLTGLEVLSRIRGFIDHFFGCRYCRNHFVEMAKNVHNEVTSHDDAILWLWERHNRVNARLAKDISTDPSYPKVQFPSLKMCDECRSVATEDQTLETDPQYGVEKMKWNKRVLLEFLKEHYGPDNIRVKERAKLSDLEAESADAVRRPRPRFAYNFFAKSTSSGAFSLAGLSKLDTSLCLIIYITVICAIVALYLYFLRRRRSKHWKYLV